MATYFTSLPINTKNDLPDYSGFCAGWFKFSYLISAPLHFKGFKEFWADKKNGCVNKLAVSMDLFFHLSFWIVPLIMEIWGAYLEKGTFYHKEVQAASLWALIAALGGILIAQLFAMIWGGQDAGRLFPSTYGLVVGGAYASIAFSCLYVLMSTSAAWPEYILSDDDSKNELAQLRKQTLWCIVLKFLAVTTAKQNAAFWGPCSPDVTAEQAAMLAESKQRGLSKA